MSFFKPLTTRLCKFRHNAQVLLYYVHYANCIHLRQLYPLIANFLNLNRLRHLRILSTQTFIIVICQELYVIYPYRDWPEQWIVDVGSSSEGHPPLRIPVHRGGSWQESSTKSYPSSDPQENCIWLSKNCQKLSFFPKNCHWQFFGKKWQFLAFCLKKSFWQIFDSQMQFSWGSDDG